MNLKFKRLHSGSEGLPLPFYATTGAAGLDICAAESVYLQPGQRATVSTGFAVEIPEGYELQVRPRSGFALREGVTVSNSPGTIDCDYRGEIMIGLINHDPHNRFQLTKGDRLAQLVLAPVTRADVQEVEELSATVRGAGGFGSTGV